MRRDPDSALDEEIVTSTPAHGQHVGNRRLDAVERAGEVHREHAVPRLERDLGERLELVDAHARDHDLDRSQLGPDPGPPGVDRGPVADVDGCRQRGGAAGVQILGGLRGGVTVEVEHRDAATLLGEALARSPRPCRRRLR